MYMTFVHFLNYFLIEKTHSQVLWDCKAFDKLDSCSEGVWLEGTSTKCVHTAETSPRYSPNSLVARFWTTIYHHNWCKWGSGWCNSGTESGERTSVCSSCQQKIEQHWDDVFRVWAWIVRNCVSSRAVQTLYWAESSQGGDIDRSCSIALPPKSNKCKYKSLGIDRCDTDIWSSYSTHSRKEKPRRPLIQTARRGCIGKEESILSRAWTMDQWTRSTYRGIKGTD